MPVQSSRGTVQLFPLFPFPKSDALSRLGRWRQRLPPGGTGGGPVYPTLSGIGGLGGHRETLFLSTSGVTHGACDLLGSGLDKYKSVLEFHVLDAPTGIFL